jgi:vitamin B12 transporter
MRLLSRTCSCSAFVLAALALAASPSAAQQSIELPEVVISSGKSKSTNTAPNASGVSSDDPVVSPTGLVTKSEQVASSVTVITSEELQRTQRRTVADALQMVPGLNVVQSGGIGGQTAIFVRGTNSNHVKVLIDGIDMGDASTPNGAFDIGHLMTADVERIEILRGPQAGLYGANTIGGVISIITKQGKGPLKVTGMVEGGSFGTFNQAMSASGSQGAFNFSFNVSHNRSTDTPVTPLGFLLPGQTRNNDFYDNWTYSTKLGYDISRNLSINMVARYTEATLKFTEDDPLAFPGAPFGTQSVTDLHQFYGRTEVVWTPFEAFKSYFGVSYTNQVRLNESLSIFNTPKYQGEQTKYDWRGVATLAPGQVLVVGLEHKTDTINTTAGPVNAAIGAEQFNNAGYLELQSQIAKRLSLVSNVRYDDNEDFGGHATWRLAPAYIMPGSETKLKASIGTGFKAPALYELFGPFGNPNLMPEESLGYDIGFEQPLLNDKVRFGVTYFHNDIKNLIDFNGPFTQFINVGQATTQGYEVFAAWTVSRSLGLRADYTFTDAVNDITGDPLRRRPKNKASVTAIWSPFEAFSLSSTVLYIGERQDIDRALFNIVDAPAYTIVNLSANYQIDEHTTLFGRIDNLFDVHYQDPLGFDRPGLGVFAGVRVTNR